MEEVESVTQDEELVFFIGIKFSVLPTISLAASSLCEL